MQLLGILLFAASALALDPSLVDHSPFNHSSTLKAEQQDRLRSALAGLEAQGYFINSGDMGVHHCTFTFEEANPFFPYSPPELEVQLDMFIKYMYRNGTATIKGFVTANTKGLAHLPEELDIDHIFFLRVLGDTSR